MQIRVVCSRPIRAEAFAERPLVDYLRDIAGWVSDRDLQQLYRKSIDADSVENDEGVPFQISMGSVETPAPSGRSPTRGR